MNTSRAGSNMPCSRIQRRRARAASARFCSAAYRFLLKLILRRAKNRHTALRVRRLRVAATISCSVRSGWSTIRPRRNSACCSSGEVPPPLGFAVTLAVLSNAAPRSPPRWADSVAFGLLAPRGPGLHLFNHPGTQVDGIGIRHRSLQKTNQCRQTRSLTKRWNPSGSSRAKFAIELHPRLLIRSFIAFSIVPSPMSGSAILQT